MSSIVCPVCGRFEAPTNNRLNTHLDQCLQKSSPVESPKIIRDKRFGSLEEIYSETYSMNETKKLSKQTHDGPVTDLRGEEDSSRKRKGVIIDESNKKVENSRILLSSETYEKERQNGVGITLERTSMTNNTVGTFDEARAIESELKGNNMEGRSLLTQKVTSMELDRQPKGKEKLHIPENTARENVQKTTTCPKELVPMSVGVNMPVTSLVGVPLVIEKVTNPGPPLPNLEIPSSAMIEAFPDEGTYFTASSLMSVFDGLVATDSPMSGISNDSTSAAIFKNLELQRAEGPISKAFSYNPEERNFLGGGHITGSDAISQAEKSTNQVSKGERKLSLLGADIHVDNQNASETFLSANTNGSPKKQNISTEGQLDLSLSLATGSSLIDQSTKFHVLTDDNNSGMNYICHETPDPRLIDFMSSNGRGASGYLPAFSVAAPNMISLANNRLSAAPPAPPRNYFSYPNPNPSSLSLHQPTQDLTVSRISPFPPSESPSVRNYPTPLLSSNVPATASSCLSRPPLPRNSQIVPSSSAPAASSTAQTIWFF